MMLPHDRQESIERTYSRKYIDGYIRSELLDMPEIHAVMEKGVKLLSDWLDGDYYPSKTQRLYQIKGMDKYELVFDILVGTSYVQYPELFQSVVGQLAGRLGFNDHRDGILTMAELLAVLCETDAYDIDKPTPRASLMLQSNITFSKQLLEYIENSCFLPPMVCVPQEIKHNRQSGYLTHNDSVILKHYNHHDEDVCLDVINLQNQVPMAINVDFVKSVEEQPGDDYFKVKYAKYKTTYRIQEERRLKADSWDRFKKQTLKVAALMVGHGNRFYFTHKVDKRGRLYTQGYHLNPQGTKHKRAQLDLADKEIVMGVPTP